MTVDINETDAGADELRFVNGEQTVTIDLTTHTLPQLEYAFDEYDGTDLSLDDSQEG